MLSKEYWVAVDEGNPVGQPIVGVSLKECENKCTENTKCNSGVERDNPNQNIVEEDRNESCEDVDEAHIKDDGGALVLVLIEVGSNDESVIW